LCTSLASAMHKTMPVLIGSNSVTYLSTTNATDDCWRTVPIPDDYFADNNWPIRLVSADEKLRYIAVSGRTGFAFGHKEE